MINESVKSSKKGKLQNINVHMWKNIKVKEFDNEYVNNLIFSAEYKVNNVLSKIKSFSNSNQYESKPINDASLNFKHTKVKTLALKSTTNAQANMGSLKKLPNKLLRSHKNKNAASKHQGSNPKIKNSDCKLRFCTIDTERTGNFCSKSREKGSTCTTNQLEAPIKNKTINEVVDNGSRKTLRNFTSDEFNTIEGTSTGRGSKKRLFSRLSFMYLNNENVSKIRKRNLNGLISEEENTTSKYSENAQYYYENDSSIPQPSCKYNTCANNNSGASYLNSNCVHFNTTAGNQTQESTVKSQNSNLQVSNQSSQLSSNRLPICLHKGGLLTQLKDENKSSRLDISKTENGITNKSSLNLHSTKGISLIQKHNITSKIISNARKSIETNSKGYNKIMSSVTKFDWKLEKRKEAKRKGSFKKAKIKEMIDERRVLGFNIIRGDVHSKKQIISTNPDNILLLSNAYTKCKLYNSTIDRLKDGYHFKKSELDRFKQDMKSMIVGVEKKYSSIDRVSLELQATMNKLNLRQNYLDNIIERKRAHIEGMSGNYFE